MEILKKTLHILVLTERVKVIKSCLFLRKIYLNNLCKQSQ